MPKKLIDLAKLLSNHVNSQEVSAAFSASEPWSVEISDEEFEKASGQISSLMTFDSAINNSKVLNSLKDKVDEAYKFDLKNNVKKDIYTDVESKVASIGKRFGLSLEGKKLDEMVESINSVNLQKTDNKAYEELQTELAKEKERAVELEKQFSNDITDFKINTNLHNKLSSVQLAKHYQDERIKNSLFNDIINEVKSKATLKLDDTGQIKAYQKDNPEMELYGENNKKLGVDDLIMPLMQNYIEATPQKKVETTLNQIELDGALPKGVDQGSAQAAVRTAREQGVKY
jgi:hypothetical protein